MNKIAEFFRTEYQRLVRYVKYRIDETADKDAEDIVQDVMLGIFDRADFTIPIENLSAYIYRAIRNKVIDVLRKKKDDTALSDVISDAGYDIAQEVERKELMEHVVNAIDALPDEQRIVLIATEFEGQSFRELAEEWQTPIGTLLARKSRALNKIKQKLSGLV